MVTVIIILAVLVVGEGFALWWFMGGVMQGKVNGHEYSIRPWNEMDLTEALSSIYIGGYEDAKKMTIETVKDVINNDKDVRELIEKTFNKGRDAGFQEAMDASAAFWGTPSDDEDDV